MARAWGCDGVHWTSAALAAATSRPDDLLCAASCHTRAEIERARRARPRFRGAGPGAADADASGRAAARAGTASRRSPSGRALPVFALGGLDAADLDVAIAHGAHGVALRRARVARRLASFARALVGRRRRRRRRPAPRRPATRYASLAQPPRSIILQRSEQNGRQRDAGGPLDRRAALRAGDDAWRRLIDLQVAEHELELDVVIVDACRGPCPATPMKRMLSAYLFALISGTHGRSRGDREPQQLRDLRRRQHQLEHAAVGGVARSRGRCRAGAAGRSRGRRGSAGTARSSR